MLTLVRQRSRPYRFRCNELLSTEADLMSREKVEKLDVASGNAMLEENVSPKDIIQASTSLW